MSAHGWAPGESDIEAGRREEAERDAELAEWEAEIHADRLGRDVGMVSRCAACGGPHAKSIYGMKCQGCFDAQREERDSA